MFEFIAQILDFFYGLVPNFAIAIMLMTLLVMLVTTPLTLKGTRSMIKMQLLQPEMQKIQAKYKAKDGDNRQEMNAEMMAFYQENEVNPIGGCFPLFVQAPVFFILFRLIQGLTSVGDDGTFDPKYLDADSSLYRALDDKTEMVSFGFNLAESTTEALGESIIHGFPYLMLILLMIGAQYLQQKQVSARNTGAPAMPQQQILLKVMPAFFGVISIGFPAALVVYWLTSSIYRIGLQAYITQSLYGGEDSLGKQASSAAAEARKLKEKSKPNQRPSNRDRAGAKDETQADPTTRPARGAGNGRTTPSGSSGAGKPHPSSKKKKKKRKHR